MTINTWTSTTNDTYTCVTAHWMDDDWKLQKRIISFVFTTCDKGESIGRTLDDCLRFWDLSSELLTVTVDNSSENDVACSYMGGGAKENGCIGKGEFVKVRCIAYIINLIVQDGLEVFGDHLKKVRALVRFCRGSPARLETFRQHAEILTIECKSSLVNDVPTQWNSTYMMLSSALKYKSVFAQMHIPVDGELGPMTPSDWSGVEKLCHFLKGFDDVTNRISGSLYATSNWWIFHVAVVGKLVKELFLSDDDDMKRLATQANLKFDSYFGSFEKMSLLMMVPAILDPHFKIRGLTGALKSLFPLDDVESMVKKVKDVAYDLFDEFRSLHPPPDESVATDVDDTSWMYGLIEDEAEFIDTNLSEFDQYLVHIERAGVVKNVVEWWSTNKDRYPVVARMAQAVLAIPISTVPSEYAFSTGGLTISDDRSNLSPEMLQALVCAQDWLRGTSLKNAKACEEESFLEGDTVGEDSADKEIDLSEGTFYICMD